MSHIDEWFSNVICYQDESDDTDIWDDTALIKAYDEAVSIMKVLCMYSYLSYLL